MIVGCRKKSNFALGFDNYTIMLIHSYSIPFSITCGSGAAMQHHNPLQDRDSSDKSAMLVGILTTNVALNFLQKIHNFYN